MKKLFATLLLLLTSFVVIADANIITRPTKTTGGTSFNDGTIPHASDFNGDADTVYTLVNGALDNTNVAVGAAVAGSKILPQFTANVQVTTAAAPCFVNINSALSTDLKQWRICQDGSGVLSIATYTDAGAIIITPMSIVRATGLTTFVGGLTLSTGNLTLTSGTITLSGLTANSFLYSGTAGLLTATAAPTNGQLLIGSTGASPVRAALTGTANEITVTNGAGTITLDIPNSPVFVGTPTIPSPIFSGTATGSLTSLALIAPTATNLAMSGGINESISTVASAATPDIFALTIGNTIDYTGTATATGFVASPQAGAQRIIVCSAASVFTAGANMLIDGVASGLNYTATAGDKILVIAVTTTQFRLTVMPVSGLTVGVPYIENPIINGNMEIWQRGTTFAAAANAAYSADRWRWGQSGAGVVTLNRSTTSNVPTVAQAGVLFNYSLEVDVTTADAAIAAGDLYVESQRIEGSNWRYFAQRQFTLSFWVSSTKTGVHCVALRNNATGTPDRSYIAEFTVNATDTWEYKTITVPASPSAGTWDYTSGSGLEVTFVLAAGSTFQTTANAWQVGNFYATSGQVDAVDSATNFFRVTGIKLELGGGATPIQFKSFQEELALAQRYYQKSFNYAIAPVQNAGSNSGEYQFIAGKAGAVLNYSSVIPSITRMRTAPQVVTYNPVAANNKVRDSVAGADSSTISVFPSGDMAFNLQFTTPAGTAVGNAQLIHWTSDAEL